jgi:hypothetical protein
MGSPDSLIGGETRLQDGQPGNRDSNRERTIDFLVHNVENGSGAHPASYTICKAAGA